MKLSFQKKTLAPGWVELRIVMERPDTPDYAVEGNDARKRLIEFVLATTAGILEIAGAPPSMVAMLERFNESLQQRLEAPVGH